jgi:predicted N-formylglutamate amidohydrolase
VTFGPARRKRARMPTVALVTCEHGGNRIPPRFAALFAGHEAILASHRGYDPGALVLGRELAGACDAPLVYSTISRLLIDLNRSERHPRLFSEFTRGLPQDAKARIRAQFYQPYRSRAEACVRQAIATGCRVLHFSSHSFTPVLDGVRRNADVGLLYDPARRAEVELCEQWNARLAARIAPLRVRRNYPYRGYDDGLTKALRGLFPADRYIGIEIEINQKHALAGGRDWRWLRRHVVQSVRELLASRDTRDR